MGCGASSVPESSPNDKDGDGVGSKDDGKMNTDEKVTTEKEKERKKIKPVEVPKEVAWGAKHEDFLMWQLKLEDELKEKLKTRTKTIPWTRPQGKVSTIRPFLSSTFRDFNDERNLFFKNSCPKLEKICWSRGVQFVPLDLRWGVTKEESATGFVIKLCNEEIDRSRPYFVCSLGFRNGWCLSGEGDETDLERTFDLAEKDFPWLKDYRDRSVTEIEIQHGALRKPNCRCYFYFRTVEYLMKVDADKRSVFVDYGANAVKLARLKHAIVDAGFGVKWFNSPQEMVDLMHEDMRVLIDRDCEVEAGASQEHVKERNTHRIFRKRMSHLYIDHDNKLTKLDEVLGSGKQGIIYGDYGSGKSALIANWVNKKLEQAQSSKFMLRTSSTIRIDKAMSTDVDTVDWTRPNIIERYIECSNYTNAIGTLHLINSEICNLYSLDVKLDYADAVDQFRDILELVSVRAPTQRPLVIVLDGLDHMTGKSDRYLGWLPDKYPPGTALLASCTESKLSDGVCQQHLKKRKSDFSLTIKTMDQALTKTLMNKYLHLYGKKVDKGQQGILLKSKYTRQPLFLITLLNEVRVFDNFSKVTERLEDLLNVMDPKMHPVSKLFEKVLIRIEEDYEEYSKGITMCVASAIHVSKTGLTEDEIKDLVLEQAHMKGGMILAGANFDVNLFRRLFLRLQTFLMSDTFNRYRFKNEFFSLAVAHRYEVSKDKRDSFKNTIKIHKVCADFFQKTTDTKRKAEELPYHLYEIASKTSRSRSDFPKACANLRRCLLDLEIFRTMCKNDPFELHKYWNIAEDANVVSVLLKSLQKEEEKLLKSWEGHKPSSEQKKEEKKAEDEKKEGKLFTGKVKLILQTHSLAYPSLSVSIGTTVADEIANVLLGDIDFFQFTLELEDVPLSTPVNFYRSMPEDEKEDEDILASWPLLEILKPSSKLETKGAGEETFRISSIEEVVGEMYFEIGRFLNLTRPWRGTEKILSRAKDLMKIAPFHRARGLLGSALVELGTFYQKTGMFRDSLIHTQNAFNVYKGLTEEFKGRHSGPEENDIIICQSSICALKADLGDLQAAKKSYEKLINELKAERREDQLTAQVLTNYGDLLLKLNLAEEARTVLLRAEKLMVRYRGVHSDGATKVRSSLAATYATTGDYKKAMKLFEGIQASKIMRYGDDHPELVVVNNGMATTLFKHERENEKKTKKKGDYSRSINLLIDSLRIMERLHGTEHILLLPTLNKLNVIYTETDLSLVERHARRVLSIVEKNKHAASDMQERQAHFSLSKVAKHDGDVDAYVTHLEKVMEISKRIHGDSAREVMSVKNKVEEAKGKAEEIKTYREALKEQQKGSEDWAQTMHDLAMAFCEADMYSKGLEIAKEARKQIADNMEIAQDLDILIEHATTEINDGNL